MSRIARAVLVAGISLGASVLAAPAAMADIHIFVVEKANVGHNGPVYVVEDGPGDLSYSNVTGSPKASPKVGNEAVKTGDIKTSLQGGKGNSAVTEVEGSEQDQVKKGHGKKDSGKEEHGKKDSGKEESGASEGKESEGKESEGKESEGKEHGKKSEGKEESAAPEGKEESGARQAEPSHGDNKMKPKKAFGAKHANVGNNGPTVVAEMGPGDVSYSNVTGSPEASPVVGNEAVKTGDIKTSLHGGKGNTAVTALEGAEQDAGEK